MGADLGAKAFGIEHLTSKQMLILDSEPYRFQRFLSDIARQDIAAHNGCPEEAVEQVRTWLNSLNQAGQPLLGAAYIQDRYRRFQTRLPKICRRASLTVEMLDLNDFIKLASNWLQANA
jgi:hypothetical protein